MWISTGWSTSWSSPISIQWISPLCSQHRVLDDDTDSCVDPRPGVGPPSSNRGDQQDHADQRERGPGPSDSGCLGPAGTCPSRLDMGGPGGPPVRVRVRGAVVCLSGQLSGRRRRGTPPDPSGLAGAAFSDVLRDSHWYLGPANGDIFCPDVSPSSYGPRGCV